MHGTTPQGARWLTAALVVGLSWGGAASAQSTPSGTAMPKAVPAQATVTAPAPKAAAASSDDPAFLSLGVGVFDVLHSNTAGELRGEYRFAQKLWIFKPFLGMEGTTKRAFYGYGGVFLRIYLRNRWGILPNPALRYYYNRARQDLRSPSRIPPRPQFAPPLHH